MYKGFEIPFKLSISLLRKKPWYNKASYLEIGQEINNGYVEAWEECISYLSKGRNILDANGIQKNWFPIVDADVFISHSHRDIDDVLELIRNDMGDDIIYKVLDRKSKFSRLDSFNRNLVTKTEQVVATNFQYLFIDY